MGFAESMTEQSHVCPSTEQSLLLANGPTSTKAKANRVFKAPLKQLGKCREWKGQSFLQEGVELEATQWTLGSGLPF